jgi:hypothetical protein
MAAPKKLARKAPSKRKASKQPCVTLEQLKQAKACDVAQDEFKKLFGKSAPLTADTLKKVVLSEHLGLWWVHYYLQLAGAPSKPRVVFAKALERMDAAETKAYRNQTRPDRQSGPQARALARRVRKLEQEKATSLGPYQEQVQGLYAQIAEIEETACGVALEYEKRIEEVNSQLVDAASDWRDEQARKAQLKAVRPHLKRLAEVAAAYLPGKDLSQPLPGNS